MQGKATDYSIGKYFNIKRHFPLVKQHLDNSNGVLYRECIHKGIQETSKFKTIFLGRVLFT